MNIARTFRRARVAAVCAFTALLSFVPGATGPSPTEAAPLRTSPETTRGDPTPYLADLQSRFRVPDEHGTGGSPWIRPTAATFVPDGSGLSPVWPAIPRSPARVILPAQAGGTIHVEDPGRGMSMGIRLSGAGDGRAEQAGGLLVYRSASSTDSHLIVRPRPDGAEDFVVFERPPSVPAVTYLLEVSHVAGLRQIGNTIELLDGTGAPRLRMARPRLLDSAGRIFEASAELAPHGERSVCRPDTSPAAPWGRPVTAPCAAGRGATGEQARCTCEVRISWGHERPAYPAVLDPAWTTTGSMETERDKHTAIALDEDRLLVMGGLSESQYLASVEELSLSRQAWTTLADMQVARTRFPAVLLGDGHVVVLGGRNGEGVTDVVEEHDGQSWKSWTPMTTPRSGHQATPLGDGRILVTGGAVTTDPASVTAKVELYEADGSRSPAPPMSVARKYHTAALRDGRVLVVGGEAHYEYHDSTESFQAGDEAWQDGPPMGEARTGHTMTMLSDGSLLIAGGWNEAENVLASTKLLPPDASVWQELPALAQARKFHAMARLPDDTVLVMGGRDVSNTRLRTAERLFQGAWLPAGDMQIEREIHAATPLVDAVVVTGGEADAGKTRETEIFRLLSAGTPCESPGECASGSCAAGACCDKPCSGGCVACTTKEKGYGDDGVCEAIAPSPCGGFACDIVSGECMLACDPEVPASCAQGYVCTSEGTCEAPPICEDDIVTDENLETYPCAPYRCADDTQCRKDCRTNDDCAADLLCTSDHECIGQGQGTEAGCACELSKGPGRGPGPGAWLVVFGVVAAVVRRSVQRRAQAATTTLRGCAGAGWTLLVALAAMIGSGCSPDTPPGAPGTAEDTAQRPSSLTVAWETAGQMSIGRSQATMTRLKDGRVLVAGGDGGNIQHASAEIFDPLAGVWTSAAPMHEPRRGHTASLLDDGRVLVAGGDRVGASSLDTSEIFDPASQTWSQVAAKMQEARERAAAVTLPDGRALVTGGGPNTAEIFDPSTESWEALSSLQWTYGQHALALLPDGRPIILGGRESGEYPRFTEIYDPATNTWSEGPSFHAGRSNFAIATLDDGRIVVIGGNGKNELSSAESLVPSMTDPSGYEWLPLEEDMFFARAGASAVHLSNDFVLVTGGEGDAPELQETGGPEILDTKSGTWTKTGPMLFPRWDHRSVLLDDGSALVATGQRLQLGSLVADAERWRPLADGEPCSAPADCSSGFCADQVCCERACSGGCQACAAALKTGGDDGTCGDRAEPACLGYACGDDGECLKSCEGDGECGEGFTCVGDACEPDGVRCTDEGVLDPPEAGSCEPYRCAASGVCLDSCDDNGDCVGEGTFCSSEGKCLRSGSAEPPGCACGAVGFPSPGPRRQIGAALIAVGLLCGARRLRRKVEPGR